MVMAAEDGVIFHNQNNLKSNRHHGGFFIFTYMLFKYEFDILYL
jgi:hypothetical protein